MKKRLLAVTAVSVLLLSACGAAGSANEETNVNAAQGNESTSQGANETEATQAAAETPAPKEDAGNSGETIAVEKGLFNNEITLPASVFMGQSMEAITADAKKQGVDEVVENADGSVTYKLSKSAYNKIMKNMEQALLDYVDELKAGTDFASIKDVTYNKSFTEFTLIVDKAAYENGFDSMASLGLVLTASYYQLFSGVPSEEMKITIHTQDEATKEVFSTKVHPEASGQ